MTRSWCPRCCRPHAGRHAGQGQKNESRVQKRWYIYTHSLRVKLGCGVSIASGAVLCRGRFWVPLKAIRFPQIPQTFVPPFLITKIYAISPIDIHTRLFGSALSVYKLLLVRT